MSVRTADQLLGSFSSRFNNAPLPGTVDLSASGEETKVDSIQAMAVKGFAQVSGPLQFVKASDHFYAAGEMVFAGDYVQLTQQDADLLVKAGRAEYATDEEVAKAQKAK